MALYLVVEAAGERFALPALNVDSVVACENIAPVPLAAPHVAGLSALRSRVLTMIDVAAAIGSDRRVVEQSGSTVVVRVEHHLYGLIVDRVEDVVEIERAPRPARAGLAPGWAAVADGMIEIDGRAALVVDPAALVRGPALRAA